MTLYSWGVLRLGLQILTNILAPTQRPDLVTFDWLVHGQHRMFLVKLRCSLDKDSKASKYAVLIMRWLANLVYQNIYLFTFIGKIHWFSFTIIWNSSCFRLCSLLWIGKHCEMRCVYLGPNLFDNSCQTLLFIHLMGGQSLHELSGSWG